MTSVALMPFKNDIHLFLLAFEFFILAVGFFIMAFELFVLAFELFILAFDFRYFGLWIRYSGPQFAILSRSQHHLTLAVQPTFP
jgi:hypothetical protein